MSSGVMRTTIPDYPWDNLAPYLARAAEHPGGALNLSIGSPVDPVPDLARHALTQASDAHAYPTTAGTPKLREAIANWFQRRRGVTVLPDAVLPTVGSKEFVALLPFFLGLGEGDAVVFPRVAYPSYALGAALAGAEAVAADEPEAWPAHTRLIWINSPANPTGQVLGVAALRAAVAKARELNALLVSDECYAEFAWEAPWDTERIPSLLDPRVVGDDHRGVLAAYSLSKQSNMAGYRAAFVAGDRSVVARLTTLRKHAGLMLPLPVQSAMLSALTDHHHVAAQRSRYRARRALLRPALETAGFQITRSEAGLYLWATRGVDAWQSMADLAELGIVAGPGHFYETQPSTHVRVALTASDATITEAARRLTQHA